MNSKAIILTTIILALLVFNGSFYAPVAGETEADARIAITNAENLIINCYLAALEAEKSGANITQLLNTLNNAGLLLSKANLAYKNGNFTLAIDLANQTQTSLNGFADWAQTVKETGIEQTRWGFIINIVAPIVGLVTVVLDSFIVWSLLKKKYGSGDI